MFTTAMGALNGTSYLNSAFDTGWLPGEQEDLSSPTLKKPVTVEYVAANQMAIRGLDWRDRIQKGTKIRYKQGGDWKYGVVFANVTFVTDTTISLTGGSDFTVANAPITDFYFSNIENPIGWPGFFNYNLQWTAATSNPEIGNGTINARFNVIQQRCSLSVSITMGSTTTYGSGIWSFSLPIPARAYASAIVTASDQGVSYRTGSMALFGGDTIRIRNLNDGSEWGATVPHTWAVSDNLGFDLEYFI